MQAYRVSRGKSNEKGALPLKCLRVEVPARRVAIKGAGSSPVLVSAHGLGCAMGYDERVSGWCSCLSPGPVVAAMRDELRWPEHRRRVRRQRHSAAGPHGRCFPGGNVRSQTGNSLMARIPCGPGGEGLCSSAAATPCCILAGSLSCGTGATLRSKRPVDPNTGSSVFFCGTPRGRHDSAALAAQCRAAMTRGRQAASQTSPLMTLETGRTLRRFG